MQCVLSCRVSEPDEWDRVPFALSGLHKHLFRNVTQPRADLAAAPRDERVGRHFIIRLRLTHSLPPLSQEGREVQLIVSVLTPEKLLSHMSRARSLPFRLDKR